MNFSLRPLASATPMSKEARWRDSTDPEILMCYRNALANWRYDGFVEFLPIAADWLNKEIGESRDFAHRLHDFVAAGGEIDQLWKRVRIGTPGLTTTTCG